MKVSVAWRSALLLLCMCVCALAGKDYYSILGVKRTATTKEIKRAYRKLALKYHPDHNQGDKTAENKFQELGTAYEALSDDEKRQIYDREGEEGLQKRQNQGGGGDPFSSFFGGFGFGFQGNQGNGERPRGADVTSIIEVTLEEIYNGEFVEVVRNKPVTKEAPGKRRCNCRMEMKTQMMGGGQFQMFQEEVCDKCANKKFVTEERRLEIEIEVGVRHDHVYKFSGEGEPHIDGDPGDLHFKIHELKHRTFERRGDDLYTNITITLQESLSGFRSEITHLDGHTVVVERKAVTAYGLVIRKPGEGMPHHDDNNRRGDLYITVDVDFPKMELSDEQRELISSILNQKPKGAFYNGLQPNGKA
ncbi:dnaJ homolog subfamily B member 11-like [Sycon ciliatum]|uniref:dnaJ homolog subfamily B member 11-like n=1 Tax=Sycon ciliatum TaxID=27933 RepID=UPI0020AE02DF|eukprot:scpid68311/ scgid24657/ DnaJ homolog subfamily B member 11; APOBEC1-binding protein 2; ER-associated DNAJ; ER-associated Hsp40 co-chaperone; ER-associated dnaJ protein 3